MNMLQPMDTKYDMPVRRTVSERLAEEAESLRARLQEVEEALEALRSNPEVENIINLVSKVNNGY